MLLIYSWLFEMSLSWIVPFPLYARSRQTAHSQPLSARTLGKVLPLVEMKCYTWMETVLSRTYRRRWCKAGKRKGALVTW